MIQDRSYNLRKYLMSDVAADPSDFLGQPILSQVPPNERLIIFLLAMIQFINILEFVIVMPLGPYFATDLQIPISHLGYIGGSYTAAAAFSGLVAAFFIEKFDRKKALITVMTGLLLSTVLAGLAQDFISLMLARVVAGLFGGQATALSLAIVADVIPVQRRGRALSFVMSAFAVASIVGVPLGLELANISSWRAPFFAIVVLGTMVSLLVWRYLPTLRSHLLGKGTQKAEKTWQVFLRLLREPVVLVSFLLGISVTMGLFLLIPNIAPYVISNLHYPRENISFLYFIAGLFTFASTHLVGRLVDRFGPIKIAIFGALFLCSVMQAMFVQETFASYWVVGLFAAFMVASSVRGVVYQTVVSLVPKPSERARFMSLQSSVQHMSSACGAFLASLILLEGANGRLLHMDVVAYIAMALTFCTPLLVIWVMWLLKRRDVVEVLPSGRSLSELS